jgi:hypothetical protein
MGRLRRLLALSPLPPFLHTQKSNDGPATDRITDSPLSFPFLSFPFLSFPFLSPHTHKQNKTNQMGKFDGIMGMGFESLAVGHVATPMHNLLEQVRRWSMLVDGVMCWMVE